MPVVLLVVEGGYSTLYTAFKAIVTKTPVLVLAGSGRAADFIAKAYKKYEQRYKFSMIVSVEYLRGALGDAIAPNLTTLKIF